jgi:hypothetical protein
MDASLYEADIDILADLALPQFVHVLKVYAKANDNDKII